MIGLVTLGFSADEHMFNMYLNDKDYSAHSSSTLNYLKFLTSGTNHGMGLDPKERLIGIIFGVFGFTPSHHPYKIISIHVTKWSFI